MKKWGILTGVVMLFAFLAITFIVKSRSPLDEDYRKYEFLKLGLDEADVVNRLGEPNKIFYKKDAPDDYYVVGYSFKKRQIIFKVCIYIDVEHIAYIYYDEKGKVEDFYVGGS